MGSTFLFEMSPCLLLEPWLCVTTAHELRKNLEVGRKGQGVLYMSMVRVQSFLGVGQQVCTPTVLTWANLHQDPSSHLVSQCKIPCSHARYVLLNLRILLVKTPLQPASSQNACPKYHAGFWILPRADMSDLNRAPPPQLMFSAASEVDMRQPIRSCLHGWV